MFKALGEIAGDDAINDCMREIAIKKAGDAVEDGLRKCLGGGNVKRDGGDSKGGLDIGNIISGACGGKKEEKGGFDIGNIISGACGGKKEEKGGFDIGGVISGVCGGKKEEKGGLDIGNIISVVGVGEKHDDNKEAEAAGLDVKDVIGGLSKLF